jgi:hypothetical protein
MATGINNISSNNSNDNVFQRNPKLTITLFIISFFLFLEISGHIIYYFTHERTFVFNQTPFSKFTPYGLNDYKANTTIRLPGYPSSLETDHYGFVHNGYKKEIGNDEYLIFIVGGSTVEGRGASSNASTIAAYLEKILNQQTGKTRFRVVNAAVCGYMSYQELSLIDGKILPNFRPKMIIALDGRNEAQYVLSHKEWKPNWMPYYDQLTEDVNKNMEPGPGILVDLFKRYSIIAVSFGKILQKYIQKKGDVTQQTIPSDERIEAAAKAYLVNHRIIHERLRLYDIKYYLFLQPTLAGFLKSNISSSEASYINDWGSRYKNGDIYYLGIEKYYKTVLNMAENLDFFHDLSTLFMDNNKTVYVDSCHYSDIGNYIIAQKLADKIMPRLVNLQ